MAGSGFELNHSFWSSEWREVILLQQVVFLCFDLNKFIFCCPAWRVIIAPDNREVMFASKILLACCVSGLCGQHVYEPVWLACCVPRLCG